MVETDAGEQEGRLETGVMARGQRFFCGSDDVIETRPKVRQVIGEGWRQ